MPKLSTRPPRMYRDRGRAYVKIDKQRISLGRWGSPEAQEAYDRTIAEWLSNGRRLPPADDEEEPATVTEIVVEFLKHARRRYDKRELSNIEPALKLMRSLYDSDPAEVFGPKKLRIVRDRMVEKGLARSTINKRVKWIRSAFRWAASHELCSERIHRRLETVEGLKRGDGGRETAPVKPVDRAAIRAVRHHLSRQVRGLILLQLYTGARADELVRLRAVDIDTSKNVWTALYDGSDEDHEHKTIRHGKTRVIYFGPKAKRVLRAFMRPGRDVNRPLFSPRDAEATRRAADAARGRRPDQKPTPKKTGRTIGDAYTTTSLRRAIHRACDKASIPKWSPHMLRHAAATAIREEFGLEHAQAVLGHSNMKITEIYAQASDRCAREVIEKIG